VSRVAGGSARKTCLLTILPDLAAGTLGNVLRLGRRVGVPEAEMRLLRLAYGLGRVIQAGLVASPKVVEEGRAASH